MLSCNTIGIPLEEVGDKLKALDKSLRENGMVLKADTGVHIMSVTNLSIVLRKSRVKL